MNFLNALLIVFVVIGIVGGYFLLRVAISYKRNKPKELPKTKPLIAWLPKYHSVVCLPEKIINTPSATEALGKQLSLFGFKLVKDSPSELVFSRGSALGDFSIKIVKVNLKFGKPLTNETKLIIEYGSFALFDTGDLWKFSEDLISKLENKGA